MVRLSYFVPFLCLSAIGGSPNITPEGANLAARYDAMDVEHHWQAGQHVDWRSGNPDSGKSDKTHCSAFVASVCERLGIYILRPPQHRQVHLATAQAEWLQKDGGKEGWKRVEGPAKAQALANEGQVVVVVFANPDPDKPGHIAFVRPSTKSEALIQSEGPQIIQAGAENANSTSLKEGFRHHKGAWKTVDEYAVSFFVHPMP